MTTHRFLLPLIFVLLAALGSSSLHAQQAKNVQMSQAAATRGQIIEDLKFGSGRTQSFLAGSTLSLAGVLSGTPTSGTLDLSNLTLTLPVTFLTTTGTQTVTNKTIDGSTNTMTNLPAGAISGVIPIANLATGTPNGSKFIRDDGTLQVIPGGGDALTTSPLSQFAATTSAQFAGVISNETGTGNAVFSESPTLTGTVGMANAAATGNVTSSTGIFVSNNGDTTSASYPSTSTRLGASFDGQNVQTLLSYGANAAIAGGAAGGTKASPTQTTSGSSLMILGGYGYNTTSGWGNGTGMSNARVAIIATESHTSTAQGARVDIDVTPNGSTTRATVASFTSDGVTITGSGNFTNAAQTRANLGLDNYTAHGNAGATEAFDTATGWHSVTLDQNSEFSFTNWPSSGTARTIVLEIVQDGTGGRTITWPAAVGTDPDIDPAISAVTLVTLSTRDGGTTIYALSSYSASSGDASTNTATSVDSEIVLFSGTGGKTLKRATTTGLLKATSGVIGAAASGTDYAPATSGTSILKGNGSGGFSNAASGTDYAPATSGTSILKGNGSGGFSNAASGTDYAPATSGSGILKGNGSGGFSTATAGTDYLTNATRTVTFVLTIDDIANSLNYDIGFVGAAFTVTEIRGVHFGTGLSSPSIIATVKHGTDRTTGTTIEAVTVTSSTTGTSVTTGFDDATVPANSFIWVETSSKSGTTDNMTIIVRGTYD